MPYFEIKLLKAVVFTNPIAEADQQLLEEISTNKRNRLEQAARTAVQTSPRAAGNDRGAGEGPSPRPALKAAAGGGGTSSGKVDDSSPRSLETSKVAPVSQSRAAATLTLSSSSAAGGGGGGGGSQTTADQEKIAAFLRSHQASDSVISTHAKRPMSGSDSAPANKMAKKSLSDFSSW